MNEDQALAEVRDENAFDGTDVPDEVRFAAPNWCNDEPADDVHAEPDVADVKPKPKVAPVIADNIPTELRSLAQWLVWRYELRTPSGTQKPAKWTKVPYNVRTCESAKSNDAATWSTFDEALATYRNSRGRFDGIGFVIAAENGIVGGDLDASLDSDRNPLAWSRPIIDGIAPSYCETSPSGKGVKFLVRSGRLPTAKSGGNFRRLPQEWNVGDGAAVELYHDLKFFTITGQLVPGCNAELVDRGEFVCRLFAELDSRRGKLKSTAGASRPQPAETTTDDQAILDKARQSKNGHKFEQLFSGNWQGSYQSQSDADLALCSMLAFYCPDSARIDQLFRQSGLVRDKWTEREDYRAETIRTALTRTEFYDWSRNGHTNGCQSDRSPSPDDDERPQIRNWLLIEVPDEDAEEETEADGKKKKKRKPIYVPMPMTTVLKTIRTSTGDWPRRVGQWLFAHELEKQVAWLESTAATFGYLQSKTGIIPWRKGTGYVTQEQVNAELQRTSTAYEAIERFPHWPAMRGHYYACTAPRPGSGRALNELLDRFSPATDIDRDLIEAMFVTPGFGGPGGCRPAFLVTSSSGGRGSGKSTLVSMVGHLWDGFLDFHAGEDVAQMKQRMLSPDGLAARVATLDNIKSLRFSWAELESLITIPKISGKRMYVGEGSRPNTLTWLLTLNGASLSKDMAQRVVMIEITKPKRQGAWLDDTIAFIEQNRTALLADVAAFYARERHPPHQFSRWAGWEREVLSRLAEPEEAQRVILERQGTVDAEGEEAGMLREYFAEQLGNAGYSPETVWVHIPSAIAGAWYNAALNEHHKIPGAARLVKQLCEEGSIAWLTVNASRANGRGFVWIGNESAPDSTTRYDLEIRLAERRNGNF